MDWERDVELLERWRQQDAQAGRELFERHGDAVIRFFRNKLGAEAQDLIQETFLRLVSARERIADGRSFRAFVLGIARRVFYEHLRARRRHGSFEPETDALADITPGPSTMMARRIEQRLLLAGLRQLAIDDQVLLELYYWEELNSQELAQVIDANASTVRTRIQRARERLRAAIEALEAEPGSIRSTVTMLDDWAAKLRAEQDRPL